VIAVELIGSFVPGRPGFFASSRPGVRFRLTPFASGADAPLRMADAYVPGAALSRAAAAVQLVAARMDIAHVTGERAPRAELEAQLRYLDHDDGESATWGGPPKGRLARLSDFVSFWSAEQLRTRADRRWNAFAAAGADHRLSRRGAPNASHPSALVMLGKRLPPPWRPQPGPSPAAIEMNVSWISYCPRSQEVGTAAAGMPMRANVG
jgi:hypothetical protein